MNSTSINKAVAYEDDEELFKQLKIRPIIAWPSVLLLLFCDSAIIFSWYMCLTGQMHLLAGSVINGIAMYYLFSPIHDSMHQAIFRKGKLNNIFLAIAVFPIIPFASGQFLRMMHMQHHRFTNEEDDPDHIVSRTFWNVFHRWAFWGLSYWPFYMEHKEKYPSFNINIMRYDSWVILPFFFAGMYYMPVETVMLWIMPALFMGWSICAVFMYLPHRPHSVKASEDQYRATLIREGWEWLLCPLMANQNYHLVHHLYPTVPFYRYRKVWHARYNFHNAQNPGIVKAFSLTPEPS